MTRACEMIADILEEAGVQYVFGIPGGATMPIFNALYDKSQTIRTILTRHEQAAAIMADAYGRATGRPAVVMGQGLFIGSNASFGIMEAYLSSSPMVVLTDTSDSDMAQHPANQSGSGEYGSVDLLSIFRAMTKYTTLATTPKEAAIGVQLAIKHSISGRPGPAVVLMRNASILGEVDVESPPFIHPTQGYLNIAPPVAPSEDVAKAARMLARSKRPVMIAGNGVHMARAHDQVRALAEMLGMAVATSYKGKSTIAETHPLAVGMVGVFGQDVANATVKESDLVLVVGAKLTAQETVGESPSLIDPKRQTIIQIDIDPRNAGWTFPVDIGLIGDARRVLNQLVEASKQVLAEAPAGPQARVQELQERKRALAYYQDPASDSNSSPLMPQRLVRLLQETLDPSTLITLDAGNNRAWMCRFYQVQQEGVFFAPGGMAGMGWSMPAALALKLVHPDRPVVGVTGDGGFMMSVHAISTALQYQLPVVYVVMNDSALGMVRHHQGDRTIASEFIETD
ncbi:MAG: thiamine pyrophosphate-binding protein, partial [Dehalococcoidia bacterium]